MGKLGLAFSAFFKVFGDAKFAELVRTYDPKAPKGIAHRPSEPERAAPVVAPRKAPVRSEALTLLASLQRESRLIDFLMEDVSAYTDAQVGAAAREVHRGARGALQRMFAVEPLRTESEGSSIEVPTGFDPLQVKLVGKVAGEPPFRGVLLHTGWKVTQTELPEWHGSEASAKVIAPAEVEVK